MPHRWADVKVTQSDCAFKVKKGSYEGVPYGSVRLMTSRKMQKIVFLRRQTNSDSVSKLK